MTTATYPSNDQLARFRARTALTNRNAGFHYLALARVERGQPWNKTLVDHPFHFPDTDHGYAVTRWRAAELLSLARAWRSISVGDVVELIEAVGDIPAGDGGTVSRIDLASGQIIVHLTERIGATDGVGCQRRALRRISSAPRIALRQVVR